MREGYNKEKECFVMHYGSESLDASLLIMPLVFFVSPTDPRYDERGEKGYEVINNNVG
jgi:GH15 family glucan-1,4-alpha-glucosidase